MKPLLKGPVPHLFSMVFILVISSIPVLAGDKDCDSEKWMNHPICTGSDPDPDPVELSNHALVIHGYESKKDIVAIDVDGGNPTQIVRRASFSFTPAGPTVWTADGARIVWSDLYDANLQMVDADGSNRVEILASTELVQLKIGGQRNLAPAGFDCSGLKANLLYFLGLVTDDPGVFSYEYSQEDFFVMDLDNLSAAPVRLTADAAERHKTLDVSPDGQFIATWTYDYGRNWDDPAARLEIRDACAQGLPVIYSWTAEELGQQPGYQFFARIDWSVDDILAISGFTRNDGHGPSEIFLVDLRSESVTAEKIIGVGTAFGAGLENRRATWSPDGTQLAFTADHDVYILDTETGAVSQVAWFKLNRDIDWRPTWVADP